MQLLLLLLGAGDPIGLAHVVGHGTEAVASLARFVLLDGHRMAVRLGLPRQGLDILG